MLTLNSLGLSDYLYGKVVDRLRKEEQALRG